jgi:hypothetical protein
MEENIEQAEPGPGEQRVDLGELLIAIKNAVERMSNQNTHRGVMVTAGSVIIHLVTENRRLTELIGAAIAAGEQPAIEQKLVSLT